MSRFKFFHKLFFFFNLLAALALLLGYVAPYLRPSSFWPIAFFGLALPYLYLINLLFLIVWVILGNIRFLLPLIFLILGYKILPRFLQLRVSAPVEDSESIKLMSFNVRVFDLYMWSKERTTRNQIFDFLNEEQPDILCLQEFYHADKHDPNYEFKTLDTLVKFLEAKNYHFHPTNPQKDPNKKNQFHYGLITFSKYPIVGKGVVPFNRKDDNACIYTDIQIGTKVYRVFNAHLASIKLNKHDYKAIQKINQNEYSNDFGDERLLVNKLKAGFERREPQADAIRKSIDESPYPVIVCGDFNDTPASYAYEEISEGLEDAFRVSGSGLDQTYIGDFPSFRIDYLFYDGSALNSKHYQTHPEKLSDHHPISVELYPN